MKFSDFLKGTLICGALDIVYACSLAVAQGQTVGFVLRFVASGPFGDQANTWGTGGAALGLAVHFTLMALMVAVGLWLLARPPLVDLARWKTGTLYGLATYLVMYGIVLPARFGAPFPNPDAFKLALGLFPHIFFVGIPIAMIAQGKTIRPVPQTS